MQALREYFIAERDRELGRWRDPENPGWVVYLSDDKSFVVTDEVTGGCNFLVEEDASFSLPEFGAGRRREAKQVLARFLKAHEPKQCEATCRVGGVVHQCWLNADHDGGHTMTEDGFTLSWGGDAL